MTMADMSEKIKLEGDVKDAVFAKNLFFANKKKKTDMWLVIAAHDTEIDLKALTKKLGVGSGNLRAGDQDVMTELLGV